MKSRGEAKDAEARPITNLKISAVAQKEKNVTVVKRERDQSNEEKVIECHICQFTTGWAAALKEHMGSAHGEQMFKCLQISCGKRYPKKKQLLRHVSYKHRDEPIKSLVEAKPEVPERHSRWCNECGKGFCNGSSLRMHMLLHSGEKPFNCDICGKGFAQKGNMITHESKCTETPSLSINQKTGKVADGSSEEDDDTLEDTMGDDINVLDDGINAANVLEEVTLPSTFHQSI